MRHGTLVRRSTQIIDDQRAEPARSTRCRADYVFRPARTLSSPQDLGSFGCRWWLQQVGGQQQRRQRVVVVANVRVVAAVLARPPLSRTEAAERRSSGLEGIDGQCSRRMILPSPSGSRLRQAEAFWTLGGCVLASVAR